MMLLQEGCPPAFGGCQCACHRDPNMRCTQPCCGPGREAIKAAGPMIDLLAPAPCPCRMLGGRHTPDCPQFFDTAARSTYPSGADQ
jgi:hypothetical protein